MKYFMIIICIFANDGKENDGLIPILHNTNKVPAGI